MKTVIGAFNADTCTVTVTFTSGDIVHRRNVNAVLKGGGVYDRTATKARVEDVATGVAIKIGLGVIGMPTPEAEIPAIVTNE